jgi:hypothetical protein
MRSPVCARSSRLSREAVATSAPGLPLADQPLRMASPDDVRVPFCYACSVRRAVTRGLSVLVLAAFSAAMMSAWRCVFSCENEHASVTTPMCHQPADAPAQVAAAHACADHGLESSPVAKRSESQSQQTIAPAAEPLQTLPFVSLMAGRGQSATAYARPPGHRAYTPLRI